MFTVGEILANHFRCPDTGLKFEWPGGSESGAGFFRFGDDVVCFARASGIPLAQTVTEHLHDAVADVHLSSSRCVLPFDPAEAIHNLRYDLYIPNGSNAMGRGLRRRLRRAYYGIRPLLPVPVRKHLQRLFLAGRLNTSFPNWPVDRTVDRLLERLLAMALRARKLECIPFIWFWPDGKLSAAIMTHDVETPAGVRFCSALMDIDEYYGFRTSFQLVPEERYPLPDRLLHEIRRRAFEVNVHDLNHDGRLYWEREEFQRRAAKINHYARAFGANGFRAGALYHNLDWYDALDFAYDMSVPNVGHLDAQEGGCCTVMPYFIGHILELPVTATQDYSLFQILGEYSIQLWIRQISLIRGGHGLINFIAHPDYLVEERALSAYRALLTHLARLRSEGTLWIALPGEINEWWRVRSRMRLVQKNGSWAIEGQGKERARIGYAMLDGDCVRFIVESRAATKYSSAAALFTQPNA